MTTATATRQELTARQIASVREAVTQRDTALVDLELAPRSQMSTEWAKDRMADVTFCNGFIARVARQWGYDPAELIAACVPCEG